MVLDIKTLHELGKICFRDDPLPCSNACPFGVDIKALMKRIQKGNFSTAYKAYRKSVIFPLIVSELCDQPCKSLCVRNSVDEGLNVRYIEKACCTYTDSLSSDKTFINPKKFKTAVIGGGIGGLGCAVTLSRRGYETDLFEAEDRLGGWLWNLPNDVIDKELVKKEFLLLDNQFLHIHLNTKIEPSDISDADSILNELLEKYNAVYIATGIRGSNFGLKDGYDRVSMATSKMGVFMNVPDLNDASLLEPLRQGIRVASSIEDYFKVGRMEGRSGVFEPPVSRFTIPSKNITVSETHLSDQNADCSNSKESAVQEAERCIQCECRECVNECELLTFHRKMPPNIIADVSMTLNAVEAFSTHIAQRQLNSCSLCGHCSEVCPSGLDFEMIFLKSRQILHDDGHMPPAYHDFWIRDLEHAMSEKCLYISDPRHVQHSESKPSGKLRYMFFPGCQLGSSDPSYVTDTYRILKRLDGETGIMLSCCGAPAYWAGQTKLHEDVIQKLNSEWEKAGRPTVITACPTCHKILTEFCSSWEIISLAEIINDNNLLSKVSTDANDSQYVFSATGSQECESSCSNVISVYDPCSAKDNSRENSAVRKIVSEMGYIIEEIDHSGKDARCCGYGGHIHKVNQKLMLDIANNRCSESDYDYITYCSNCRDMFASQGKRAIHICDLFSDTFYASSESRFLRKPPDYGRRRRNRELLKISCRVIDMDQLERSAHISSENDAEKDLFKVAEYINSESDKDALYNLHINDEIYDKMNSLLLLEDDIADTILYCETTNDKILIPTGNSFVGRSKVGAETCWVSYRPDSDGFTVLNVYSHRMEIE